MSAPTTPERQISVSPRCDKMVQGGGLMSYHCSLPQGHEQQTSDPEDPQPCYAVESGPATRRWQAWSRREHQRKIAPAPPAGLVIDCPTCHEPAMKVTDDGGACENCGATAEIQQDLSSVSDIGEPMLPGDGDVAAPAPADPERDVEIREAAKAFSPAEVFASLRGDGCGSEHSPGSNPNCVMSPAFEAAGFAEAPESLRQRPEDQILPSGDEAIPDDQSLVIADIETRREVGITRYGQGHRPFNGRNTLLDAYEESLDGAVYLRSLLRARATTKGDLIDHLGHALDKISKEYAAAGEYHIDRMAAELADRVTDYVTLKIEEAKSAIEPEHPDFTRLREAQNEPLPMAVTYGDWLRDDLDLGTRREADQMAAEALSEWKSKAKGAGLLKPGVDEYRTETEETS